MLGNIFDLDRTEGSQTDMQCHIGDIHTHVFDLLEQFRCEVQTGSWCGGRTRRLAVDGLIAFWIFQLFLNIRRERHHAQFFENFQKDAFVMETNETVAAVRQNILYGGGQLAFAKAQLGADTAFLARTGQTFPYTVALIRQQNQLNRITGVLADAQQTSRNDAGIVENQRVSGTQVLRQIVKMSVLNGTGVLVQCQHARSISLVERRLCN